MAYSNDDPHCIVKAQKMVRQIFSVMQFVAMICIGLAAAFCFSRELIKLFDGSSVHLGDLLLLFLYSEIIVMAKSAIGEHRVLIAMPISIAVVALARTMVVSSDHNPMTELLYAGGIFVLILGLTIWMLKDYFIKQKKEEEH